MKYIITKRPRSFKSYIESDFDKEADRRIAESSDHDKAYYSKLMIDVDDIQKNPPETWKRYKDDLTGDFQILTMEFNELRQDLVKNDHADMKMNLEHLLAIALKLHERLENE